MASFPNTIVSISNPISTSKLNSPSHAAQHTTINAEVIAIETILGTNPQGSYTTVKDRLNAAASVKTVPFTNSDLSTGVLSISGEKVILCVRDNDDEVIIPDSIVWTSSNTKISLVSFGTITGTYEVDHL